MLAVAATGGLAAGVVAGLGLQAGGLAAAVATGATLGAVGGAAYNGTHSTLSGNDLTTVLKDMLVGAGTGALTGGALSGIGYGVGQLAGKVTSSASGTAAKNAASQLDDVSTGVCFVAGTLVLTAYGKKAIEDIKVGDKVYAKETASGTYAEKEVKNLYRDNTDTLVHLRIAGEEIVTTETHPFYVDGKGWVEAGKLTEKDKVQDSNHQTLEVEKIEIEKLEEPVTVYNLEVEDYHTYFVGDGEVLVHNKCTPPGKGGSGAKSIFDKGKDVVKKFNLDDAYVKPKHLSTSGGNGAKFLGSSKAEAEVILRDAMSNGKITSIVDDGISALGNSKFEITVDAGKAIGTKGETFIKVILSEDGGMLSAYPVK